MKPCPLLQTYEEENEDHTVKRSCKAMRDRGVWWHFTFVLSSSFYLFFGGEGSKLCVNRVPDQKHGES